MTTLTLTTQDVLKLTLDEPVTIGDVVVKVGKERHVATPKATPRRGQASTDPKAYSGPRRRRSKELPDESSWKAMQARFNSSCLVCTSPIEAGSDILYKPATKTSRALAQHAFHGIPHPGTVS